MDPKHSVLPDAHRYQVIALRWERSGPEPFLDLTLRHRDTSALRRLRFHEPVDVHIDPDIGSYGFSIADVSARQMDRIGVEVFNLEGPGALRFFARDVVDLTQLPGAGVTRDREGTQLSVAELRRVANEILDALEATGHEKVTLVEDFYWNIPSDRLYRPEAPSEASLDLGQLTSDWDELSEIGRSGQGPVPSHDLVHLAAVLRYLASQVW